MGALSRSAWKRRERLIESPRAWRSRAFAECAGEVKALTAHRDCPTSPVFLSRADEGRGWNRHAADG